MRRNGYNSEGLETHKAPKKSSEHVLEPKNLICTFKKDCINGYCVDGRGSCKTVCEYLRVKSPSPEKPQVECCNNCGLAFNPCQVPSAIIKDAMTDEPLNALHCPQWEKKMGKPQSVSSASEQDESPQHQFMRHAYEDSVEQDSEGELKPCPHCGGEAEELIEDRCSNVHCPECCGVVYGNSIEDARRKWNRREPAPTDQGQDIITCSAPAPENCEWSERIKDKEPKTKED